MIPVKESSSKGEFLKRMVPVNESSSKREFLKRMVSPFTGTFLYRNHSFQVSISPTIPGQQLRNENKTKKMISSYFQIFSGIFRYFQIYFQIFFTNIRIYLIISSLLCNKLNKKLVKLNSKLFF